MIIMGTTKLTLIDKNSINYGKYDENLVGEYYYSDLWEIHATFMHYRCESYTNRVRMSMSSSCIESTDLPINTVKSEPQSGHSGHSGHSHSVPSSPKSSPKPHKQSASQTQRMYHQHQNHSSTSSLSGILKRIKRLKKSSKLPSGVDRHETGGNDKQLIGDNLGSNNSDERKSETSGESTMSVPCSSRGDTPIRSKSDTRLTNIISPKQKSFQELKSMFKFSGPNKYQKNKRYSNLEANPQIDLYPHRPPLDRSAIIPSIRESPPSSTSHRELPPSSASHRVVRPPQSLNIRAPIVINNLPIKRVPNKMTSMESIGTCSLDINNDNVSVTNNAHRSISERSLKSATLVEENSAKISGKSSSLYMLKNGHRLPSYVGISCAISGYTNYSRYCTSLRNSSVNGESPLLPSMTSNSTRSNVQPLEPVNSENNLIQTESGDCDSLQYDSFNSASLESQRTNEFNNEHLDTKSSSFAEKNVVCDEMRSDSLVEQRIVSLYGKSFAAGWRQSRNKHKYKQFDSNITFKSDNLRSPSPLIQQKNGNEQNRNKTKSPPVFRHITKVFLEQLQLETAIDDEPQPSSSHDYPLDSTESIDVEVPFATMHSDSSITDNGAHRKSSPVRDGNWFLVKLSETESDIKLNVNETQNLLTEQCDAMSEDVSGKLRAAIGKANLLMTKKFNQFRELCTKNINQNADDKFQTTNEDLEGFWDMMSLQICDVKETFSEINELQRNGWRFEEEPKIIISPIKSRSQRQLFSPKGSPAKSFSDKSSSDDSSSRDVERRNRLKEAKRRQAKLMAAKNDDITIFTPTNSKK